MFTARLNIRHDSVRRKKEMNLGPFNASDYSLRCHLVDISNTCFKDAAHHSLSKNMQEIVNKMSTRRCIPAFTWAHCWNTTFSNSAWERIKEKSGSSLCTKFSRCTLPFLSVSLTSIKYWGNVCVTFSFQSLSSPCHSSPSLRPKLLWLSLALCESLSPFHTFSSLCSAALDSSDIMPKPVLSLGSLQWGRPPVASVASAWATQSNQLCYHLH